MKNIRRSSLFLILAAFVINFLFAGPSVLCAQQQPAGDNPQFALWFSILGDFLANPDAEKVEVLRRIGKIIAEY